MKNSFLALREMEMAEFRENRQDAVRENVRKQLHSAEFISNVLELFFPKMADTITVMLGGEAIEGQGDYPRIQQNDLASPKDPPPSDGPTDRDEIIR